MSTEQDIEQETFEYDNNKKAFEEFLAEDKEIPDSVKGAILNYLLPCLDSLRDEATDGLQYLEAKIGGPDYKDFAEIAKSTVAHLLKFNLELLRKNGWLNEETGLVNALLPADLKLTADNATRAAGEFMQAAQELEAMEEEDEEEEEEEEEEDEDGNESGKVIALKATSEKKGA